MRSAVEIRPARPADAEALAPLLRAADRAEVLASDGLAPLPALRRSLALSGEAHAGFLEGELAVLFGVRRASMTGRRGIPWLLSGPAVARHPRAFLRASRAVVAGWRADYSHLGNWVDARYGQALRWLAWLGFTLHPARPYGALGLPFHPFEMEGRAVTHSDSDAPPRGRR